MIRRIVRACLPYAIRQILHRIYKALLYTWRKWVIKWPVLLSRPIKVIIGAAKTRQDGWYSTNEQWLDITNPADWDAAFKNKPLLTHIVAEHVFEHLTHDEAQTALQCAYRYSLSGGRIRIAVPDGYNQNPEYQRHVGINGLGDDAADHKQLLNCDILGNLLEKSGFKTQLVEGYNRDGILTTTPYDIHDGFIRRSRQNTAQRAETWDFPDAQTSLIMDGTKP